MKKRLCLIIVFIFLWVNIVLSQEATPTPNPTETLFDLLSDESCEIACFMGIEPGVTMRTEVEHILSEAGIDYYMSAVGYEHPDLETVPVWYELAITPELEVVLTGLLMVAPSPGPVLEVYLTITPIPLDAILNHYGMPTRVAEGNGISLYYPTYGLTFHLTEDNQFVDIVTIQSVYTTTNFMDVPPCTEPDDICNLPTATPLPDGIIYDFTLMDEDYDVPMADELYYGGVINLSKLSTRNINIRAELHGAPAKVVFTLNGEIYSEDTHSPFTLLVGNIITPVAFEEGDYTLTATPYDANNHPGTSLTWHFTITSDEQLLRDVLTHPDCEIACFMGIEPGKTTQNEVKAILKNHNLNYTVVYTGSQGDEANSLYDFYPDIPPYIAHVRTSVVFQNGLVTQIIMPIRVDVNIIQAAFGNPARVTHNETTEANTALYYIEYPDRGLIFQIPDYSTTTTNAVFFTDAPVEDGQFMDSVGSLSVNQICREYYGEPPCIAPTAYPATATMSDALIQLLSADSCERPCFMGFESGKTTWQETREFLNFWIISYNYSGAESISLSWRGFHPLVNRQFNPASIDFINEIIHEIMINTQPIPITSMIEAFRYPTAILQSNRSENRYAFMYPQLGLSFATSGFEDQIENITRIYLVVEGAIPISLFDDMTIPVSELNPCTAAPHICAIPTATPTP